MSSAPDHRSPQPAHLVVVGGLPGAGKTTFGRALARALPAALVDKDTVTRPLVSAAMAGAGLPPDALDDPWYQRSLRPAAYTTIERTAAEIVRTGTPAVVVAPYLHRVGDPTWPTELADLADGAVRLVWLRADEARVRERLTARGAVRDAGKLADWPAYAARLAAVASPAGPHVALDTSAMDRAQVEAAAEELARTWRA